MSDPRLRKMAEVLVHYSVGVKPGDLVFIHAGEVAIEWIEVVAAEVIKTGAHVETLVNLPQVKESLLKMGNDAQLLHGSVMMKMALQKADVLLTAWGTRNTKANSNIDSQRLQLAMKGDGGWQKIFSKRMGEGSLRWCGALYPTNAEAQEALMSLTEYQDFVYDAGLLGAADPIREWEKVRDQQEKWVNFLNQKSELRIKSEHTDLKVNVSGRKWVNCCGKLNFPDGEIFTSPVENGVNGYITFSYPGIYLGKEVEGIYLEVRDGKVITASANKGEDLLKSLLETDRGARYFGEVAIGTNYQIPKFTKNMLFDEKLGGTVHLALGDSLPRTGGQNHSIIHWDMLCDMKSGGQIYADGELFYEQGRLLV
ncbi:MAG TPA: aminopeptidase [Bacillota bacterium]|nr:aminopeptidase [Bacillota bacterium]